MELKVLKPILSANDQIAEKNHKLLAENGVFAINLMSSPGAGKTNLILQTIRRLKDEVKIGVIEGDIASTLDAEIISKEQVPVVQINTGGECHLEARMLSDALEGMTLKDIRLLFIENVGNLICPAEFKLGEHKKVMMISVTEGDDKPHKYPLMFTEADVVLINKVDLLPYVEFNVPGVYEVIKGLNPKVRIFPISCKTGEGISDWLSWLLAELKPA